MENPDIGVPPPAWKRLRFEAQAAAAEEPTLSSYLNAAILSHATLGQALSFHLAEKLSGPGMGPQQVRHILSAVYDSAPSLIEYAEADMQAVIERDPAARGMLQPFLFFKGSWRCRPTGLRINSGGRAGKRCRFISRAARLSCSTWTFTRQPGSGAP